MRIQRLAVIAALGMAGPAMAATSFTSDFDQIATGPSGWATFASADGWTGGPNGIEIQSNGVAGAPHSGINLVELDTSANSAMSRTIDAGVYTLSFAYSARPGTAAATNGIGIYLGDTLLGTYASNGSARSDTSWLEATLSFTAGTANTLTFAALGASDGLGGYLDTIALDGAALPVSEPGEWAMIAAGLGVAAFAARRRGVKAPRRA